MTMNVERAAMLRFLYVWMRSRGIPKSRAEPHLKEISTFSEKDFATFLDELTRLMCKELPQPSPQDKGLN